MHSQDQAITPLLTGWAPDRDPEVSGKLISRVYGELKRLAGLYLSRERPDHTLQATDLAHETYLRLAELKKIAWRDRIHFFAVAARMMRRILVDHARRRKYVKRGGGAIKVVLQDFDTLTVERPVEFLALDRALNGLAEEDPLKAWVVELRFFAGLTIPETARALGSSTATVNRHWQMARAWLYRELRQESAP